MNRRDFFGLAAAATGSLMVTLPAQAARAVHMGGPIRLTDHTGKQVDSSVDFAGRPMLINFGYTSCPDVCPTTLQTLTVAVDIALDRKPEVADLAFLFVSFDPERDDVTRIAEYVALFHPQLIGLTGSEEQIATLVKDWKAIRYIPKHEPGADYAVHHPAKSWLVDRQHASAVSLWYDTPAEEVADEILKLF